MSLTRLAALFCFMPKQITMSNKITWKLKLALLAALPVVLMGVSAWLDATKAKQATAVTEKLTPSIVMTAADADKIVAGYPKSIAIPSQNISLDISEGTFNQNTGEWTLSNDKAHFAVISRTANNHSGNTFIYGHNSDKVFKRLGSIKEGDTAEVLTDNGYKFVYKYRTSVEVSPRDTSIFSYEGPAILTLQTCSGSWDQNRQLLTFDLERVEKL